MSSTNLQVVLAERPKAAIIPDQTFAQKTVPAPTEADLQDGQILVEVLYLSLDPAMRGWMNDRRSYIAPVAIDAVMRGANIARVLASRSTKAARGDVVQCYAGWQEYAVLAESQFEAPLPLPANGGRLTDLLGVLGGTGLTAYFGLEHVAKVKPGDLVVVSGAAGATGSVVGQIAKKVKGAGKVVGLAGSDDKCKWLVETLGFDVAVNYKDKDFKAKFREATEGFIDVYWDNVGGEILDLALARAKKGARFVMCGGISQYNSAEPYGVKNITQVVTQRIIMQGFIVFDYASENAEARKQLAQWLSEGKIERSETIVKGGLKMAPQALVDLYSGINTGKLLVEVKSPESSSKL